MQLSRITDKFGCPNKCNYTSTCKTSSSLWEHVQFKIKSIATVRMKVKIHTSKTKKKDACLMKNAQCQKIIAKLQGTMDVDQYCRGWGKNKIFPWARPGYFACRSVSHKGRSLFLAFGSVKKVKGSWCTAIGKNGSLTRRPLKAAVNGWCSVCPVTQKLIFDAPFVARGKQKLS